MEIGVVRFDYDENENADFPYINTFISLYDLPQDFPE
jgi:hypothetical protein